jgi:hypothetical protein
MLREHERCAQMLRESSARTPRERWTNAGRCYASKYAIDARILREHCMNKQCESSAKAVRRLRAKTVRKQRDNSAKAVQKLRNAAQMLRERCAEP